MDNLPIEEQGKVYYQLMGKGIPLVFLHGFLEDASIWLNIVEKLKDNYQILLIDLPGHGRSSALFSKMTVKQMAEHVREIIVKENLSKPIVFGHSLGGYIALELACMIPVNLALVHSNFWADSPAKKNDRNRVLKVVDSNLPLFVKTAIPNLFYENNRHLLKNEIDIMISSASVLNSNAISAVTIGMRDRLDNSQVLKAQPVAIIQGAFDPIIPSVKMEKELEEHNIKAYYYVIDNCGHMGFLEKPDEFFDIIMKVIDNFSN